MRGLIWLAGGIAAGAIMTVVYSPAPIVTGCGVERVMTKVATAYVLKPPPPIEHVTIVKEACVSNSAENETKPESTNADETQKPRHRRWRHMRRHRRHW
jgi:hypothetical protein